MFSSSFARTYAKQSTSSSREISTSMPDPATFSFWLSVLRSGRASRPGASGCRCFLPGCQSYAPAGQAGRGRRGVDVFFLAVSLALRPGKPAGGVGLSTFFGLAVSLALRPGKPAGGVGLSTFFGLAVSLSHRLDKPAGVDIQSPLWACPTGESDGLSVSLTGPGKPAGVAPKRPLWARPTGESD